MSKRINENILARRPFITIGAMIMTCVSLIAIFLTILYVVHLGKSSRQSTCKAISTLRDTTANVLVDAEHHSQADPQAQAFYHRNILKIRHVECNS